MAMSTDSAVSSLQADLTALRAENKELTERLNELEATAEVSAAAEANAAAAAAAAAAEAAAKAEAHTEATADAVARALAGEITALALELELVVVHAVLLERDVVFVVSDDEVERAVVGPRVEIGRRRGEESAERVRDARRVDGDALTPVGRDRDLDRARGGGEEEREEEDDEEEKSRRHRDDPTPREDDE